MATSPLLSDGIILTGFSYDANQTRDVGMVQGGNTLAENQPSRFLGLDTGYLTWPDKSVAQYEYFSYGDFDPEVLSDIEANKMPFTVGQLLTIAALYVPAAMFRGPVLVSFFSTMRWIFGCSLTPSILVLEWPERHVLLWFQLHWGDYIHGYRGFFP